MKRQRLVLLFLGFLCLTAFTLRFGNTLFIAVENPEPSQSVETKISGSLINGKRLPTTGPNFVAYSWLGALFGRNTVHSAVRATILDAYRECERETPGVIFVYGETGWPNGGRFRPHKSHQNGLSVDFFVPVIDEQGRSTVLPHSVFSKFGYGIDFDETGKADSLRIDFKAMAAHLTCLLHAADENDIIIEVVIFTNELQQLLFQTSRGKDLQQQMRFSTKPSWVRHDEHYHVDFIVPQAAFLTPRS